MADSNTPLQEALNREDPVAIAQASDNDTLGRIKTAEDVIEARFQRKRRSSRISVASQVLVGWVALAGFFVNAYQSFNNRQQQQKQAEIDQNRWAKEFERAQQADKYRAFFETAALATDATNADKRLVGYTLLKEFVNDHDYNRKAELMLEESLEQVLRTNTKDGIDEEHRNAVTAILTALAETDDCRALMRAAQSIDKIAKRHAKVDDDEEAGEVFNVYVREVIGAAATVCKDLKDFRTVRRPLRDTLIKIPGIASLKPPVLPAVADLKIAEILRDRCVEELAASGASDCPEIFAKYDHLCTLPVAPKDQKDSKDDQQACALIKQAAAATASQVAPKVTPDGGTP